MVRPPRYRIVEGVPHRSLGLRHARRRAKAAAELLLNRSHDVEESFELLGLFLQLTVLTPPHAQPNRRDKRKIPCPLFQRDLRLAVAIRRGICRRLSSRCNGWCLGCG